MQKIAIRELRTRFLLAEADAMILLGAGVLAALIRFGSVGFDAELNLLLQHPGFILYAVLVQFGLATTFDLYRPFCHLSNLYAASARAEVAHCPNLRELARRGVRNPWPVLGPNGHIVCHLPGERAHLDTCGSTHKKRDKISSGHFHSNFPRNYSGCLGCRLKAISYCALIEARRPKPSPSPQFLIRSQKCLQPIYLSSSFCVDPYLWHTKQALFCFWSFSVWHLAQSSIFIRSESFLFQ